MIFLAISLVLLCGTLSWSSGNARLVTRNNQFFDGGFAAEVATEKVVASIAQDYYTNGETWVSTNLTTYQALIPTAAENSTWTNYLFTDAQGNTNKTYVAITTNWNYGYIETKYAGLNGYTATYRVISNARSRAADSSNVVSAVRQDIQLVAIPIFEFAIFYAFDLEICPGSDFSVTGRTHSNGSIYLQPTATLTFQSHVTAAQQILHTKSANDPTSRVLGTVTYRGEHDSRAKSMIVPIGTNNNATSLHALIEIPPSGESTNSLMGQRRMYNKADLIILVSNNTVVAKSGAYNNYASSIPWATIGTFIDTNLSFYNYRESLWVQGTEFDVTKFNTAYASLTTSLGRSPKTVYVADVRTQTASTQAGVRLINGATLSTNGMTVATLNPLYVMGHFNAPVAFRGTTNTSTTAPASLIGDAVTFLSIGWTDSRSGWAPVTWRPATSTTFNAGVIAGIVQSGNGYYSGGVENMVRLLEDWSGKTMTFNGSMVALFTSQTATAPWGASSYVYNTPTRLWSWDPNFSTLSKLPPGVPYLRSTIRGEWQAIQVNSLQ